MKIKWIDSSIDYDGTQLRSLYNYLEHGILGDSVIAFQGACKISFEHMLDGEDIRDQSPIQGAQMLHFIFELFGRPLEEAVVIQRLFACLAQQYVFMKTGTPLLRVGDDLYLKEKKLSISIAAKSVQSVLIHFAVNITNEGTPVPTISLQDLKLDPQTFARDLLSLFQEEWQTILDAACKVRPAR